MLTPRRVLSTPTTITVRSATQQAPAWVQAINPGEFATIPATPSIGATAAGYGSIIASLCDSDSGWQWNDHYGPGGGMLFTGGGHAHDNYPYAWVFDGLKVEDNLPGWRVLNIAPRPPSTVPGLPALTGTYAPFKWDDGSEASSVQANMPAGAVFFESLWFMYSTAGKWGIPFSNFQEYGECGTGVPSGFHSYQYIYPLAPGELGAGAKGGWATDFHSSVWYSGEGTPWGHIIDAATGTWTRQQYRWPAESGGISTIGSSLVYAKSCVVDGFAYTIHFDNNVNGLLRTNLTDGTRLPIRLASTLYRTYGGWTGVPGTTVMFYFRNFGGNPGFSIPPNREFRPQIVDVNPALPYTSRIPTFININPATPNPLAAPEYWGSWDPVFAHSSAQAFWIAEVGKFATFSAQKLDNVTYGHGDWPFGIVWYTPPNPPEQGTATWFTGLWTCEFEPLTVRAGDTRAQSQNNRGVGTVRNASGGTVGSLWLQYRCTFYSEKLRCFIHMPNVSQGNIFFFRSTKLP